VFELHPKKNVIDANIAVIDAYGYVKKGKLHFTMEVGHSNDHFRPILIF
jgi:hypothetical protein